MEYIDGERLDKRIERLGMMPETEVIPMAMHCWQEQLFSTAIYFGT